MSGAAAGRVALVTRGVDGSAPPNPRLVPVFSALVAAGLSVDWVPYVEGRPEVTADRLSVVDAALVWVDPLSDDGERCELDEVLRAAASMGVWVSAHPDVIDRLGSKEVLVEARDMSWGSDVHLYAHREEFARDFPHRLAAHGVRVLKASRGNGGRTVWKVRLPPTSATPGPDTPVIVQRARVRDGSSTVQSLASLIEECSSAFAAWRGTGRLIDQEFIAGISRGIIRCYLVGQDVVGFSRQIPSGVRALGPIEVDPATTPSPEAVMGLPSSKTMYGCDEPSLAALRHELETSWVPALHALLDLGPRDLPALWDIDLIPTDRSTANPASAPFVLCEINASSVIPFPPETATQIAKHVKQRLHQHPTTST